MVGNVRSARPSKKRLRPDEVLFKRKNAPVRYEEDDYYPAHRKLPADRRLPSGSLAMAIHAYISKFTVRSVFRRRPEAWRHMNESALLAMCILMEETVRGVLGETGDLALTEAGEEKKKTTKARRDKWTKAARRAKK